MKRLTSLAAFSAALMCGTANAQQVTVKIGVMSDMSSLYADIGGPGSTAAAKLAIADFAKANPNIKVELLSADHQNKADVGSSVVNQWFDVEKVDMVVDVPNSGVALAVSEIARVKNKAFVVSGAAASDLTGGKCNANTVHWTYDTWMLANGTGKALVKTGGDTWFFLTADYAFGHALERDTGAAVEANKGKVVGKVRHPLNTNDFSSFLLQAQASRGWLAFRPLSVCCVPPWSGPSRSAARQPGRRCTVRRGGRAGGLDGARHDPGNTKPGGCGRGLHVLGDAEDRGGGRHAGDRREGGAQPELAGVAGHDGRVHEGELARAAVARPAFGQQGVATTMAAEGATTLPQPPVNTSFTT